MIVLTVINHIVFAQLTNMHSNTGSVMKEKKYVGVEGSPYLYEDWRSGTFTDVDGKNRGSFKMRYNIYDDELEIIKDNKAISINHKIVKEFEVFKLGGEGRSLFRSGYPANNEYGEANFYKVLNDDGEFNLLKKYNCTITNLETKGYGESTLTQKFLPSSKYYIYSEKTGFTKINKSKKSILEIFSKHEKKIKAFIKSNKINVKNDGDLAEVVKFYNSIN